MTTPDEPAPPGETAAERVARLCGRLWESWQRGERVPAEDLLRDADLGRDAAAAVDLIYAEFLARQELGERPSAEEYLARFPNYREPLGRQFELDHVLAEASSLPAWATAETVVGSAPGGVTVAAPGSVPPTVGRYAIVRPLGEQVYLGMDPGTGREVVVRLGSPNPALDAAAKDRFRRAGQVLTEFHHPNLTRVLDLGLHEGRPFLVTEYVPGRTLRQHAGRHPPTPARAAVLTAKVARAVAAAHRAGLGHGGLGPDTILVDETGEPRDVGFGQVWLAGPDPGRTTGTGAAAADLLGLGTVLYFLLTGDDVSSGDDALARSDAAERLKRACLRALDADPTRRFPNAEALAVELERASRSPDRTWWVWPVVAVLTAGGLIWLLLAWLGPR